MDIFDEVDMESSQMHHQPSIRTQSSKLQDATAGTSYRPLKALRCKMDEVPLGADSGEIRNSSRARTYKLNDANEDL